MILTSIVKGTISNLSRFETEFHWLTIRPNLLCHINYSLTRCSNIWKTYFKPLDSINCVITGDRVQNILWQCHNLQSSPHLQNAVIMCGTNNIQHNSVKDTSDGIVEIALSLRYKYHSIAIFACILLPRDNNWSINRLYVLVMSRTRFRVNTHSIVAWMSRNSLLEAGVKSEG